MPTNNSVLELIGNTPMVRVQTSVVVAFATLVEYLFSPTLEVYLYRFDNVPMYVPPGHGLVYLSAFALGHTRFVERHMRACTVLRARRLLEPGDAMAATATSDLEFTSSVPFGGAYRIIEPFFADWLLREQAYQPSAGSA